MTLGILNRANNLTDYYDSMYWWDGPPHNFIYADDAGNIAITVAGRFPIRQGYSGNFPVIGLNDSIGMIGSVPYAFNPRSVNPSQCFLQSANQKSIDPATYPYTILGAQSPDYRGERIHTVLQSATDWTVEDMMQLQADVVDLTAVKLFPYVRDTWLTNHTLGVYQENTTNEYLQWMMDWDYKMDTNSPFPTIWIYLLEAIRYEMFDEVRSVGLSSSVVAIPLLEWVMSQSIGYYIDDHTTDDVVEDMDTILFRAINRAFTQLFELGDDATQWEYGDYHTIRIDHLASLTYIGGGEHRGSGYTINVGANWVVQHGPSRRMIVHYEDIPTYNVVYPGGQSQVMFSKHWDDLFDLWYAFDPVTETYNYILEYNFISAGDFQTADDGTMIEYIILFRTRS
jgi:penicillin amidase